MVNVRIKAYKGVIRIIKSSSSADDLGCTIKRKMRFQKLVKLVFRFDVGDGCGWWGYS